MILDKQSAMEALASASAFLHNAGIVGIYFDDSGSGWNDTFNIIIETQSKPSISIRPKIFDGENFVDNLSVGSLVEWPVMPPEAERAVRDALSGLELPVRISLGFEVFERVFVDKKSMIWPVERIIERLKTKSKKNAKKIESLGKYCLNRK